MDYLTYLDGLVHRSCSQHIYSSHCGSRIRVSIDHLAIPSRTSQNSSSPSHARHKVSMRIDRLDTSTGGKVPGSDRLVV